MSNYKPILFCIALFGVAPSCKIHTYSFRNERDVNKKLFTKIPQLAQQLLPPNFKFNIRSVTVFKAKLEERLVERDGIPEFKLINTETFRPELKNPEAGNYNLLYLFYFDTDPSTNLCIFLSTRYDVRHQCTKLGPAYLGDLELTDFTARMPLKVSQGDSWYLDKEKK